MLEHEGWLVFRCARSKPIDLIAIKNNEIRFIECKASKWIAVDKHERIFTLAKKWKLPIHIYKQKIGSRDIIVYKIGNFKGVLKYGN